jgi:hypothetical protein
MGLSLSVGIISELLDSNPSEANELRREFVQLNKVLVGTGLAPHVEPETLEKSAQFHRDMLGYHGLHYVRRIGLYLAFEEECPGPGPKYGTDFGDEYDLMDKSYFRKFQNPEYKFWMVNKNNTFLDKIKSLFNSRKIDERHMSFMHLIVHGDANGIYVPQVFQAVRAFDSELPILGAIIGSTYMLRKDCKIIAKAIGIPDACKFNDDDFDNVVDSQGSIEAGWNGYSIEAHGCLCLIEACEASIRTGAALVFR